MFATIFRAAALAAGAGALTIPGASAQQTAPGGFVDPVPIVRIGPPPGYEYAFTDDRLNPDRGLRTPRGDAQSAQVWTETVPRRAIPISREAIIAAAAPRTAAHPAPARGTYVQVASFRQGHRAQRAAAEVAGAGLPARVVTSGGYEVVLAGPLGSGAERQRALQTARGLGYADAFLR
jgi:hypothetical protein